MCHANHTIKQQLTNFWRPEYPCNVIGGPILTDNEHHYDIDFKQLKLTIAGTSQAVSTFEGRLMQLRLPGNPCLKIADEVASQLRFLVIWPNEEQYRWKAKLSGEEFVAGSHASEPPYDDKEKTWLRMNYTGEYRFLLQKHLSIHNAVDRSLGRKLAREEMRMQVKQGKAKVTVSGSACDSEHALI